MSRTSSLERASASVRRLAQPSSFGRFLQAAFGVKPAAKVFETVASGPSRREIRDERRGALTAVVRETMIRAGVLSSQYRFKTLALEPSGRTFIALVDLTAQAALVEDVMLLYWEKWICQSAQSKHGIEVRSVYWRREINAGEWVGGREPHAPGSSTEFGGLSATDFGELPTA